MKSLFKGRMKISDAVPPESYAVSFDLHGGLAGFARGQAKVALQEAGARETRMVYEVNSTVGGKIALVGSRLVDAAAATMSDRFFTAFAAQLTAKHAPAEAAATVPAVPGFFATLWAFLKCAYSECNSARPPPTAQVEQEFDPFFVTQVREGKCVLFAGAGLSAAAGYPSWASLLRGIVEIAPGGSFISTGAATVQNAG